MILTWQLQANSIGGSAVQVGDRDLLARSRDRHCGRSANPTASADDQADSLHTIPPVIDRGLAPVMLRGRDGDCCCPLKA